MLTAPFLTYPKCTTVDKIQIPFVPYFDASTPMIRIQEGGYLLGYGAKTAVF